MMQISKLVGAFEESATLALAAKAKKLAASGRSVINFGVGEPDFNTPNEFIQAAYDRARGGETKYTPVPGTPSLRKVIAESATRDYRVAIDVDEVLVSSGGKQAIYHFLQATVNPGDEVLILSPYWVSFPEMVKMVGGVPVIVKPAAEKVQAQELAEKISSKTRVLIFNSPSNPSGSVYTADEIRSLLDVIRPNPIWLLSDDTYYQLVFEPAVWTSALHIDASFKDRTCIVGSASKSYAMTGWRLGWAIGPKALISAMSKLQSQVTSGASSLSQAAAEFAIRQGSVQVGGFRKRFKERRDLVIRELSKIPNLGWLKPDGAFYVFVDFSKALDKPSATEFCSRLLEEFGVCLIPGEAFGDARYARLSYALSEGDIKEGISRISRALSGAESAK